MEYVSSMRKIISKNNMNSHAVVTTIHGKLDTGCYSLHCKQALEQMLALLSLPLKIVFTRAKLDCVHFLINICIHSL